MTCCRTISSIMPVVSAEGSDVSPETYIIYSQISDCFAMLAILTCWISVRYLAALSAMMPDLCTES